jgi:predicted transcriptional regulator
MMELTVKLPDEVLERLQNEAERLNVPLDVVVNEALECYLEDDAEPTKAEILASLRISMQQALAGNVRPADEVLDEIEREALDNADHR